MMGSPKIRVRTRLPGPRVDRCMSHCNLFGCFFPSSLGGLDLGSLCEFVDLLILAPLSPVQELRLVRRSSSAEAGQRGFVPSHLRASTSNSAYHQLPRPR